VIAICATLAIPAASQGGHVVQPVTAVNTAHCIINYDHYDVLTELTRRIGSLAAECPPFIESEMQR
jgi:V8-like Glu-specific endopeptidase